MICHTLITTANSPGSGGARNLIQPGVVIRCEASTIVDDGDSQGAVKNTKPIDLVIPRCESMQQFPVLTQTGTHSTLERIMSGSPYRNLLDRHIQTIVAVIIAGLIGWAGIALQEMQKSIASMAVQISTLQAEVSTLRQAGQTQYTQTEASRDWERYYTDMQEIRARVRSLEQGK